MPIAGHEFIIYGSVGIIAIAIKSMRDESGDGSHMLVFPIRLPRDYSEDKTDSSSHWGQTNKPVYWLFAVACPNGGKGLECHCSFCSWMWSCVQLQQYPETFSPFLSSKLVPLQKAIEFRLDPKCDTVHCPFFFFFFPLLLLFLLSIHSKNCNHHPPSSLRPEGYPIFPSFK